MAAPIIATLAAMAEENRSAPRPCPDLAEWLADMVAAITAGGAEAEAAAEEVRAFYVSGLPIGAQGTYQPDGAPAPLRVETLAYAITYGGRAPEDFGRAWDGVSVRFSPVRGYAVVNVDSVAWDAVRLA